MKLSNIMPALLKLGRGGGVTASTTAIIKHFSVADTGKVLFQS
jgi:hypothetical protein